MAKNYDVSRLWPPTIPKKGVLPNDFVLITPENRKNAIQLGRIVYKIELNPNKISGWVIINPPLTKGWHNIPHCPFHYNHPMINGATHWRCYYDEDTDYDWWAKSWKRYVDDGIKDKNLYIRITDPILIYDPN